jgi:tetratricopeptide (TPR) repeat protein
MNQEMRLAESYRQAGQFTHALASFQQTAVLLTALGRDHTQSAGTMFNDWALTLDQLGRPLEAERNYRRALDISRAGAAEEGVSQMLLLNYARTQRELGHLEEAAGYAERAYAKAQRAHDEVVIDQALLERARIDGDRGLLARAEALLAEVEPRLRRDLPAGHYAFAGLALERGLLAQAHGDLPAALDLTNRAMAILNASVMAGGLGRQLLPTAFVRRSEIEFQFHRPGEAAADALQAVRLMQAAVQPGTYSSLLGNACLDLGRALQAANKREDAGRAFRTAAQNLETTLGPDHPHTLAARQLAALNP